MKIFFMVTASHIMNMVTKLWISDIIQGEMLEYSTTSYDVGDVIKWDTLLLIVTP
jgi:hypothetical protein